MAETLLRTFRPSAADPWDRAKVAHLLGRAGFGGTPDDIARLAGMRFEDAVEGLLEYERISDEPFHEVGFSVVQAMGQALEDLRRGGPTHRGKELIQAISQGHAMLSYLENNSNRKGKPNENYARELMELFTLGVGNFGEQDVKEAARAFTGWTFAANEFVFRRNQHDDG